MIGDKRVLAIVPARAGSKGLPGKNIRPLGGKPLLAWPIEAALASAHVDRTIVSTDSAEYAEIAQKYGAEAPFLRPPEHAIDTAPSIDFILHAIDTLALDGDEYHYLVLLEPTSPLTEASDIDGALNELAQKSDVASAAIGVALMETQHPAYAVRCAKEGLISPMSGGDFSNLPRRQDLEPIFALDGSFYISTVEALVSEKSFCHDRTLGLVTERHKAYEVDDIIDFICIEAILKHRTEGTPVSEILD